ncbi:MAG: excalibur calcium-binding domain-containing protein [Cohaesibacteraceae bacterium]
MGAVAPSALDRLRELIEPAPNYAQSLSCSPRRTCGQINSCQAARWYLNNCSWGGRLDRDRDGRPCESGPC